MSNSTAIATLETWLPNVANDFEAAISDDRISLAKEAGYAVQLMNANPYAMKLAQGNQQAFRDAIINVAAVGVSLNPAAKQAYLVPRDGKICLDLSYMGLMQIAIDSGSVLWVQCKIVYQGEDFQLCGVDEKPVHKSNPFAKKSIDNAVGAYCVAKTHDGAYLTECMSIDDIHAIRARSQSFKSGRNSPWKSDPSEMIRKTVIKRAAKYWPKSDRLNTAIDALNRHEGIDFSSEQKQTAKDVNCNSEMQNEITSLLNQTGGTWEQFLPYVKTEIGREIERVDELTVFEAGKFTALLTQKLKSMQRQTAQQQSDNVQENF